MNRVREKMEIVKELGGFSVSDSNDLYIYFNGLYRLGLVSYEEIKGLQRDIFIEEEKEYYKA